MELSPYSIKSIVLAYMNRQSKTTYDNLEKLAATSASIIYAEAGYHP